MQNTVNNKGVLERIKDYLLEPKNWLTIILTIFGLIGLILVIVVLISGNAIFTGIDLKNQFENLKTLNSLLLDNDLNIVEDLEKVRNFIIFYNAINQLTDHSLMFGTNSDKNPEIVREGIELHESIKYKISELFDEYIESVNSVRSVVGYSLDQIMDVTGVGLSYILTITDTRFRNIHSKLSTQYNWFS